MSSPEDPLSRPIGWWLKRADASIEAAFASALTRVDLDRRGWQLLEAVASGMPDRTGLAKVLRPFGTVEEVGESIDELVGRGLLAWHGENELALTPDGRLAHGEAAAAVRGVRERLSTGMSREEYASLVRGLARIVANLDPQGRAPGI